MPKVESARVQEIAATQRAAKRAKQREDARQAMSLIYTAAKRQGTSEDALARLRRTYGLDDNGDQS